MGAISICELVSRSLEKPDTAIPIFLGADAMYFMPPRLAAECFKLTDKVPEAQILSIPKDEKLGAETLALTKLRGGYSFLVIDGTFAGALLSPEFFESNFKFQTEMTVGDSR